MEFEVSLFRSKRDNVPLEAEWSWDELCEKFRKPIIRAAKDGPLFSPARFNGTRAIAHAQSLSLLVFDLDHNADLATMKRQLVLLDCKYLVCSTHSHLRITESNPHAEPRYRVVIPLTHPVPANGFPSLWHYAKQATGLPIDESAKDASRVYYTPAIATPEAPFEFYEHEGEALNWERLPLSADVPPHVSTKGTSGNGAIIPNLQRNSELFKRAKKLYDAGLTPQGVETALLEINTVSCEPPLEADEVIGIARNAKKYPIELPGAASGGGVQIQPLPVVRLSEVEAKEVNWLWEPMIPKGFFTLCDGVEGIGKTYLMLKVAAMVANGGLFPGCSESIEPGEVLLLSAEDSPSYVLKPRLIKMGVAGDQIFALDGAFTLDDTGFLQLSLFLAENNIKFVLIDPLFSFTGKINLNTDSEIRTITDRLNRMAERHACAMVGVRHIGKTKGYGDPRNAGLNGVGWRAGARCHLIVGHHPEDKSKRALAQTKTNLTAEVSKSYGYTINESGNFLWTGESDLTVETMLSFKQSESIQERSARDVAKDFLADQLSNGRVGSQSILDASRQAGISDATLKRAKQDMGIKSVKDSQFHGGWYWELPGSQEDQRSKSTNEGSQTTGSDTLRENEASKRIYDLNLPEGDQVRETDTLGEPLSDSLGKRYAQCDCGEYASVGKTCPHCMRENVGLKMAAPSES